MLTTWPLTRLACGVVKTSSVGDAVFGRGGAALPFMAVGKPDLQVGARSGIMQGVEPLSVQPFGALAQHGIVLLPRRDGVIVIDPRGDENRIREFFDRDVVFVAGKHQLRP